MEVVAEAGAQQPWDQFKEEVEIMEEQQQHKNIIFDLAEGAERNSEQQRRLTSSSRLERREAADGEGSGAEGGGRRGRIRSYGRAGNRWGKAAAGEGAPDRGEGASNCGGEGRPKRGPGSNWSGVGSRRGRTLEMWTTEEPGEGEEQRSPGGGKERQRKTTARAISNRGGGGSFVISLV